MRGEKGKSRLGKGFWRDWSWREGKKQTGRERVVGSGEGSGVWTESQLAGSGVKN